MRTSGIGFRLLVVLLTAGSALVAQQKSAIAAVGPPMNPTLLAAKWPAAWIACPDAPQKDVGIFYFRKDLTLSAVPVHFWVHVSADNRFQLHVNGFYVGEGPARGDLFHWRFETIDLAPFLHSGKNVLAAVVWNFGSRAPVAQMSNRTGFLLQGDTESEKIVDTDTSWRVKQEPGRSLDDSNVVRGYFGAGPGEKVDGRNFDWSWDQPGDTSSWQEPKIIGRGATREAQDGDSSWGLVADSLPTMEHRKVDAGTVVRVEGLPSSPAFPMQPVEVPANAHVTLLLDNSVLQTAYPDLTVSGGKDAIIKITYAEALYDVEGHKGNRNEIVGRHIEGQSDEFIADGGSARSFQPLWWRTWRYLQIDVTTKSTPLRLDKLTAWFTAYPFDAKAKIVGDIPELTKVWDTGWRTARLCAHETYMDAPYWEQLQYVGDTRIQALISYAMTGDSRLARQAITNIDASRTMEGITQSRYPSGQPQFIPTFSLLWIDMLHDYWLYVDDVPLVRDTLPHTRTVIDWYTAQLRLDGLVGKAKWWEFADWTSGYEYGVPPQDVDGGSALITLQFIEALKNAGELEALYGSRERAAQYKQMAAKATDALNRLNWDEHFGVYADTPGKKSYSQQANILAVWLDVAPQKQQASILHRVLASKGGSESVWENKPVPPMSEVSYYFRFYLTRALEHAGMADLYLDQLTPWRDMLKLGLSTWAENPEPARSDCHAWSASPNYDLLTVVAGIRPVAPGFARVRMEPHLGKLTNLDATMPSVHGDIHVTYKMSGGDWLATVTLPKGLSGEFFWKGKVSPLHEGEQILHLAK